MRAEDCIFGCEYSGHFFFRDLGGSDDGLVAALQVLKCICGGQPKLSQLVAGLPPMYITSEHSYPGRRRGVRYYRCAALKRVF